MEGINGGFGRAAANSGFGSAPPPPMVDTSPYVTIPAGLSPTALLDSPVSVPNSQLPTLPFVEHLGGGDVNYQTTSLLHMQLEYDDQNGFLKQELNRNSGNFLGVTKGTEDTTVKRNCITDQIVQVSKNSTEQPDVALNGDNVRSKQLMGEEESALFPTTGTGRLSEDGYNWRKYGQKQVKGSEYPRSYYKCTHPSCLVKKKVECALDGQITEIIYKGSHNHPKPQPTLRSIFESSYLSNDISDSDAGVASYIDNETGSTWTSSQQVPKDKSDVDWNADGQEMLSSASVLNRVSHSTSASRVGHANEFGGNIQLLSTRASQNDEDDGITQPFDDAGKDESEPKRRKKEDCFIESNSISHSVREPRVVVRTVSKVDILEDGYRWRKYGQKVVKGNPNPRSYYKCTTPGCSVRKHVERASDDLKSVLTTYEGKHNHEVPAARNSTTISFSGSIQPPPGAQASMLLPAPTTISKPESQCQNFVPYFDKNLKLCGNFTGDLKFENSSYYEMDIPHMQHMPLGPFSSDNSHWEAHQAMLSQDLPISFSADINHHNLAMIGYNLSHGRSVNMDFQSATEQQLLGSRMMTAKHPKKKIIDRVDYGSPVSTMLPMELSPPESTVSDELPFTSGQSTGRRFPL